MITVKICCLTLGSIVVLIIGKEYGKLRLIIFKEYLYPSRLCALGPYTPGNLEGN
jgi:hypothetical protein